jgi:hypothetical protein
MDEFVWGRDLSLLLVRCNRLTEFTLLLQLSGEVTIKDYLPRRLGK